MTIPNPIRPPQVANVVPQKKNQGVQIAQPAAPVLPKVNTNTIPGQNPAAPKQPAKAPAPPVKPPQPAAQPAAPDWIGNGKPKENIPEGYQMTPGGVKPIPGGPADPNKQKENTAINQAIQGQAVQPGGAIVPPVYDAVKEEEKANEAFSDFEKTMKEDVAGAYKAEQDALVKSAENKYAAEMQILSDTEALQQQLAAQQASLIESSAGIQKQEAQDAYDANLKAIDLQKKKVAEAYKSMKQEQELANKQRQIREETALGLIYGGFGSVAANKNIEETIMRGEQELVKISNDAVNADTELQNKVVEINNAYSLDLRKIDQWKAEETTAVYSELQKYIMDIKGDKMMAEVEKTSAINKAVSNYNVKVAEINSTVAQTKYDLSLSLQDKLTEMKQTDFNNKITADEYNRGVADEQRTRTLENLDLLVKNYSTEDFASLPADVKAQMSKLEESIGMPKGFAEKAFETYKESLINTEAPKFEYYTNKDTGQVQAITFDVESGQFKTYDLGNLTGPSEAKSVWKEGVNPNGQPDLYNATTGQWASSGGYAGAKGTPEDALNVPDGSRGGQCGRFVNDYTGLGLGDEYQQKLGKMDPSITEPQPGDVFVMPYSWTGHAGFIVSINGSTATVKDSNWSLDEKVKTHQIKISEMTGFYRPGGGTGGGNQVKTYVDMAEKFGTDYARSRLKEAVENGKMQASLLAQFESAIQTGTPGEEVPEKVKNLPYVGGVYENFFGPKPSLLEKEMAAKEGGGSSSGRTSF